MKSDAGGRGGLASRQGAHGVTLATFSGNAHAFYEQKERSVVLFFHWYPAPRGEGKRQRCYVVAV